MNEMKDYHYRHNYGNATPAGRKRKGHENAALHLQLRLSPTPDSSEQAHPEIRCEAEPGSQANQVRSSRCLCWVSPEIPLLLPCKKSFPLCHPQKGSGMFLSCKHCSLETHHYKQQGKKLWDKRSHKLLLLHGNWYHAFLFGTQPHSCGQSASTLGLNSDTNLLVDLQKKAGLIQNLAKSFLAFSNSES